MDWIYKYSWYESKRHRISYTDMYFAEPSIRFDSCECFVDNVLNGIARVHYICVPIDSWEWGSAVDNTDKEKLELIKKNLN